MSSACLEINLPSLFSGMMKNDLELGVSLKIMKEIEIEASIDQKTKQKKLFSCDLCDSNFASKQNVKRHIDARHEGKKPFKCDECNTLLAYCSSS